MDRNKHKGLLIIWALILSVTFFIANASAQPEILSSDFYTDNWGPNPLGWPEGHQFFVCAKLKGVYKFDDSNLPIVQAIGLDPDGINHIVDLNYDWTSTTGNFTWFCAGVKDIFHEGGKLTINATDSSGDEDTMTTCPLDKILKMDFAENINYTYDESNQNIKNVSWDPVLFADSYFIRFYIFDDEIQNYRELYDCRSEKLDQPNYEITSNSCNINGYGHFVVRVLAQNYDECDKKTDADFSNLENRSSTWAVSKVFIGDCVTNVDNYLFDTGDTMNELIRECYVGADNHGQFVKCVSKQTNDWKKAGLISGKEKGAIVSCAARQ
jgi:hypothetical protein